MRCARARELGQPFSQAIAATYLALLQQLRADPDTFRRQAEEALELATSFKATYYRAWAAILVAYARDARPPGGGAGSPVFGAPSRASRKRGRGSACRTTSRCWRDAHLRAGEAAPGSKSWSEALSHGRETNERWWDAELHRLRAECCWCGRGGGGRGGGGPQASPRDRGRPASEVAGAARRPDPGRPGAGSGRTAEARDLLAPVYSSFTEGLETPDLAERPGPALEPGLRTHLFDAAANASFLNAGLTPGA